MKLTCDMIQAAVDVANECLHSMYPKYVEPNCINIKFTNARSYWAMISQSTGKPIGKYKDFEIKISSLFSEIQDPKLRNLRLEECMIHELIHTIPGCNNHGYKFKALAQKINLRYPQYRIEVQTDGTRFGLPAYEPKRNYEILCKDCGRKFYRTKQLRKPLSEYMCSNCGSDNLEIKKI